MKRTIRYGIVLLMVLVAGRVSAVYQYDSTGSGAIVANAGGWFDIMQDSTMTVTYYSPASKYGQNVTFGYFTFDDSGVLSQGQVEVKPNATVALGDLVAGTQIGFWLSSAKTPDQILYSVNDMNVNGVDYFFSALTNKGETYWTFGDSKWGEGAVIAFITGGQPVVGQPLPGTLASLLLGGGALCGLRRKKRTTDEHRG